MKWLFYGLAFAAGAVVGGYVVREVAINKIENPIADLLKPIIGDYATGATVTAVDTFIRSN
jgi:hypothetical protein